MASIVRIISTKIKPQHFVQIQTLTQIRQSSFKSSPFLSDLKATGHSVEYEKTKDPIDWENVQNALPRKLIPNPTLKDAYSSGWKPSSAEKLNLPYYVERTKNHMMPVYLRIGRLGIRRVTTVRKVKGDMWKLHRELEAFLQKQQVRPIRSQVNELTNSIHFYGDWVNAIKHWLDKRGF